MTKQEFITYINKIRKTAKNDWYYFNDIVEDKHIFIKGCNTWLQVYQVNDLYYGGLMGLSVKQFIEELNKPFN